jgi:hypothetical protein
MRARLGIAHGRFSLIKNTFLVAALVVAWAGPASAQTDPPFEIGGGRIDLIFVAAPEEKLHKLVRDWVQSCAHAVTAYYGTFPVDRVLIRIRLFDGHGVRSGQTFGNDGAFIKIAVGRSSTPADFADDWMMTHEMIHLAFPSMAEQHHWIEEGLMSNRSRVRKSEIRLRKKRGAIWWTVSRKACRNGATAVWTLRQHGAGRTGAVRYFACSLTLRSGSAPGIKRVFKTLCAQ